MSAFSIRPSLAMRAFRSAAALAAGACLLAVAALYGGATKDDMLEVLPPILASWTPLSTAVHLSFHGTMRICMVTRNERWTGVCSPCSP